MCGGSIAVILALSCGFAEIFAAIGFTIGALAVAPEVVVVLVDVPEAGVVIVVGVVLVAVLDVGAPDFGTVTCGCGVGEWPCCGSASAGAPTRHVAAATLTIVRAKDIRHPRTVNEASEMPAQLGMKCPKTEDQAWRARRNRLRLTRFRGWLQFRDGRTPVPPLQAADRARRDPRLLDDDGIGANRRRLEAPEAQGEASKGAARLTRMPPVRAKIEPILAPSTLPPGTRLGPYEILDAVGAGGMGRVYRARDPRLDRQVAIKLLPPETAADHAARLRLRREAMAVAALDHPYICKIFEIGEYDATLRLVMEYVPGDTLERRLKAGRVPLAEALSLAGEVAEALEEAHARRFLHRDLKPANIMLTPRGHVKVMDFGLAKRVEDLPPPDRATELAATQLTMHGTIVGTPDYMSPEQVKGLALDPRSDLFSFGVILAEMIGGRHPFRRPSMGETLSAVLREPPELGAEIPSNVMPLIRRLLAKSPEDRYQSAAGVRADLARLAASREAVVTAPVVSSASSASWRKQIVWAAFAIGLTVAGYLAARAGPWASGIFRAGRPGSHPLDSRAPARQLLWRSQPGLLR
jgi:serine/threonine protein kinase